MGGWRQEAAGCNHSPSAAEGGGGGGVEDEEEEERLYLFLFPARLTGKLIKKFFVVGITEAPHTLVVQGWATFWRGGAR